MAFQQMINTTTLELTYNTTSGSNTLYLAPFGLEDLRNVYPIDRGLLIHELPATAAAYSSAEHVIEAESANTLDTLWGIFTEAVSPQTFLGTIGLLAEEIESDGSKYGDARSKRVQEVGTTLLRAGSTGRGFGSLAKLAVLAYAFEVDETHAVSALTSPANIPAHKSLAKVGFEKIYSHDNPVVFNNGLEAPFDYWFLADKTARASCCDGDPNLERLLERGWQKYLRATQSVRITTTPV
jgi:RimJ/RimL family protein N-acetyltransferase